MLDVDKVAEMLGVHRNTVISLFHEGRIKGRTKTDRPKSPIVLYEESVEEYIRKLEKQQQ